MKRIFTLVLATMLAGQAWTQVFQDGDFLCNITIDNTAEVVGYYTNSNYPATIVIPDSITRNNTQYAVTGIGGNAFYNYGKLISVIIPNTVKYIGDYAFSHCGLTSFSIPDSVTSIGNYAFEGCRKLTSINIPNTIKHIGDYAFRFCTKLIYNEYSNAKYLGNDINPYLVLIECQSADITSCEVNSNCKIIASYAFSGCQNLTSIAIPNSIQSISNNVFDCCYNLDYTTYNNAYYIGNNENPFMVLIEAKNKNIESCEINDKCRIIYAKAFDECEKMSVIVIPESVIDIGNSAFKYCRLLKSVSIPNSVKQIGDCAFSGCQNMESVTIGNSVERMGIQVFLGCYNLESVVLGNLISSIGRESFAQCSSLNSIDIPSSVTSIRTETFYGCNNLTTIIIPSSVKGIGYGAFSYCSKLNSITIPHSVTSIEECFKYCDNLEYVVCLNPIPITIDDNLFNMIDTIYVPADAVNTYKTSAIWKRKEILPLYEVKATSSDNAMGTVQGDSLLLADKTLTFSAIPANDYHFVKWCDGNTDNPRSYSTASDTSFTAIFEAHKAVTDEAVAATCTTKGLTEGSHCSICGEILVAQNETPMVEHTVVVDADVAATATTDGLTEGSHCSVCGAILVAQVVIPALGEQGGNENQGGGNEQGGNNTDPASAVSESSASAVIIYAIGNTIVVENATEEILVYDAMGALVGRDVARNVCTIRINNSGIYIVKTSGTVKRVMVK